MAPPHFLGAPRDGGADPVAIILALSTLDLVAVVSSDRKTLPSNGGVRMTFRFANDDPVSIAAPDETEGGFGSLDPVIARLASALDAAQNEGSMHAPLYADGLRLAIAARLAGLHSPARETSKVAKGRLLKWRLQRVSTFIDENLERPIKLADLARTAGLSRMHFAAQFREETGLRPHDYVIRRRVERACELMAQSDIPLVQVALAVGFQTQAHFTTVFKRVVGDTPHRWRKARVYVTRGLSR